jgi:uncharacterized protein (DUF39 family)
MKSVEEINARIAAGKAVVLTASEIKKLKNKESRQELARRVDVVTTATFGPMCSSGVFLNLGHAKPATKFQDVTLDGVAAYGGIAAADVYLGATEEHPENQKFGGAHVIRKLVNGEAVKFKAKSRRTSACYPGESAEELVSLDNINQAYFYNPRNSYQNYNAATNSSDKVLHTYMGRLEPGFESVNFSGAGAISPLLADPELRTIGIGSRIFFCGGVGYVTWEGTQFNGQQLQDPVTGLPVGPAATLAITADLRQLDPRYVQPVVVKGYGISINLAIGAAIPVLDEDIIDKLLIEDRQIETNIVDYATGKTIGKANYEDLLAGKLELNGRYVKARSLSNANVAEKVCHEFKELILAGDFELTAPVQRLPLHGRNSPLGAH